MDGLKLATVLGSDVLRRRTPVRHTFRDPNWECWRIYRQNGETRLISSQDAESVGQTFKTVTIDTDALNEDIYFADIPKAFPTLPVNC